MILCRWRCGWLPLGGSTGEAALNIAGRLHRWVDWLRGLRQSKRWRTEPIAGVESSNEAIHNCAHYLSTEGQGDHMPVACVLFLGIWDHLAIRQRAGRDSTSFVRAP